MNQQAGPLKILLVGDSCVDEYLLGTVDRISPEAPVPIVKIVEHFTVPGMAANVQLNLKKLGIDCDFLHNTETITKTRYIDRKSGQHLLRVDNEPIVKPLESLPIDKLSNYDAIVISDYNKGFLNYEHIEDIIKSSNAPIFIDTKKKDLARFSADNVYIKINELEFNQCSSLPKNLIVTLGNKGAMLKQDNETLFPTQKVEVMDVCGCGDTFLSALTYQYLLTKDINQSIVFANKAASITVQHRGNYAPELKEII